MSRRMLAELQVRAVRRASEICARRTPIPPLRTPAPTRADVTMPSFSARIGFWLQTPPQQVSGLDTDSSGSPQTQLGAWHSRVSARSEPGSRGFRFRFGGPKASQPRATRKRSNPLQRQMGKLSHGVASHRALSRYLATAGLPPRSRWNQLLCNPTAVASTGTLSPGNL